VCGKYHAQNLAFQASIAGIPLEKALGHPLPPPPPAPPPRKGPAPAKELKTSANFSTYCYGDGYDGFMRDSKRYATRAVADGRDVDSGFGAIAMQTGDTIEAIRGFLDVPPGGKFDTPLTSRVAKHYNNAVVLIEIDRSVANHYVIREVLIDMPSGRVFRFPPTVRLDASFSESLYEDEEGRFYQITENQATIDSISKVIGCTPKELEESYTIAKVIIGIMLNPLTICLIHYKGWFESCISRLPKPKNTDKDGDKAPVKTPAEQAERDADASKEAKTGDSTGRAGGDGARS
jgi:hypothetical protein